jgi:hypothetical protein
VNVTLTTKPQQSRPWQKYRDKTGKIPWKICQPGWGGELTEEEVQFLLSRLLSDPQLAFWWGFRPQTKRRPVEAIKAVAMWGHPDVRGDNVKLVRKNGTPVATQMALPWG